jgi:hypothetical protein
MSDLPAFDDLVSLAKEDPKALETLRQTQVEKLIRNAPSGSQRRQRGIQFQIDAHRQLHAHSPMGSCLKISELMHESFAELRGWLNKMAGTNDPLRDLAQESNHRETKVADILACPSSKRVF